MRELRSEKNLDKLCRGSYPYLSRVAFIRMRALGYFCAKPKEAKSMAKKLFVGGLAWATTTDGLRHAFEAFGSVTDAKVILDRETKRSRGFGFVTFDDNAAADKAIEAMNGTELEGRRIQVNEAQARR